jgi:hypothetical protein
MSMQYIIVQSKCIQDELKFGEFLLLFSLESFFFISKIIKIIILYKKYTFFGFIWMWTWFSKRRAESEGV